MKDFIVMWTDKVQRSVVIPATCADTALEKWNKGDYSHDDVDQNDCCLCSDEEIEVQEV